MEKSNTKLFLEVDASQIDVKQLLRKDFLELSMKAISSANPNRNNSWFTKESMERSVGSFINKPILGYFENGDFVSHNGDWIYDSETEMDYWDTLGKKGERILGIIRESDEVKIIEDKDGLSWVTFTCALWTQYSFKQVKRLIKDAKRAQKTGESTKNISVEVDITDYDILDNGVMKINEFNLIGVTILGTRNGVKVEPGIENAELSVVDVMGREVYSAQEKTLRLAYEKLNNSVENKEESQVENENIKQNESSEDISTNESTIEQASAQPEAEDFGCGQKEESQEGVCPECGKNPCECEKKENEEGCGGEQQMAGEEEFAGDKAEDVKQEQEQPVQESDGCETCEAEKCEEKAEPEQAEQCEEQGELTCEKQNAEYEELLQKYNDLFAENQRLQSELEKANAKVCSYEHKEFIAKAYALIQSAKLDDSISAQFRGACDKSEIKTIEDLKVKVAVAAFEAKEVAEETVPTFSASVVSPDVTSVFEDNNKPAKNKKGDHWSALHDYIGK